MQSVIGIALLVVGVVLIIFLANPLPRLRLWPRRHSEQQHLFERPYVIRQSRGHRGCTRPPLPG